MNTEPIAAAAEGLESTVKFLHETRDWFAALGVPAPSLARYDQGVELIARTFEEEKHPPEFVPGAYKAHADRENVSFNSWSNWAAGLAENYPVVRNQALELAEVLKNLEGQGYLVDTVGHGVGWRTGPLGKAAGDLHQALEAKGEDHKSPLLRDLRQVHFLIKLIRQKRGLGRDYDRTDD